MEKFKSVDAGKAAVGKLAFGAEGAILQRQLAEVIYGIGCGATGNAVPDCTPVVDLFNDKFRGDGMGRKPLKDNAAKTYRSVFNRYAELGFAKWPQAEKDRVFKWVLDNAKMAYSTRGKFIGEVATMKDPPAEGDLKSLIDSPPYNKSANMKELAAAAARIAKAIALLAITPDKAKDTDPDPEPARFAEVITEDNAPLWRAYAGLFKAANDFNAACVAAQSGGGTSDKIAALLAAAA